MAEKIDIEKNLERVRLRIAAAAARSGRRAEDVLLVAVSKGVEAERIEEALAAGVTDLGENYLQEARDKQGQVTRRANWHFIGHLQRNKVKAALDAFGLIESVDSPELLAEINRRAAGRPTKAKILIQVNTSGEESKFGIAPERAVELVRAAAEMPAVEVQGLMTIGRLQPEAEAARGEFRLLAGLFCEIGGLSLANVEMRWLSMGMSHDFEVAIEEGANLVRIGRGIFGPRRP